MNRIESAVIGASILGASIAGWAGMIVGAAVVFLVALFRGLGR